MYKMCIVKDTKILIAQFHKYLLMFALVHMIEIPVTVKGV